MKILMSIFLGIFLSMSIWAHEGPAFPILVDRKIANFKLSIWADPDTGQGTFSLYLEGEKNPNLSIDLAASPVDDSGHTLKAAGQLVDEDQKRSTYKAILPFDRSLNWNVEFKLKENGTLISSFSLPLEVTPPGPNKLEFAVYLLPFLLVGFIWIRVVIAKKSQQHKVES